jgi:hypothetical protein
MEIVSTFIAIYAIQIESHNRKINGESRKIIKMKFNFRYHFSCFCRCPVLGD